MGKRREFRRVVAHRIAITGGSKLEPDSHVAAAHRLANTGGPKPEPDSHVAFHSPYWHRTFFHTVTSGENVWVLPPDSHVRSATPQEQTVLKALETKHQPKEPEATDWVIRQYGTLQGPYFYSCILGRAQLHPPASGLSSAATSSKSARGDAA